MIFYKHSLIAITILNVVIWVMPVTSQYNFAVLQIICSEMLEAFTTYRNNLSDINGNAIVTLIDINEIPNRMPVFIERIGSAMKTDLQVQHVNIAKRLKRTYDEFNSFYLQHNIVHGVQEDRFFKFCQNRINEGQNMFIRILYNTWYQVFDENLQGGYELLP